MTTPPTTAGWYPDPDDSGGQRYWDGSSWTDQRPAPSPETPESEETSAWPTELPPWPEDMAMPSWDAAGKAESADAATPDSAATPDTAPEPEPEAEPEALPEPEPEPAPEPEPEPAPEPAPVIATAVPAPTEQPTAAVPTFAAAAPEPAAAPVGAKSSTKIYLAVGAALLVVLAAALVWAFLINKSDTGATGSTETPGTAETTGPATDSAAPADPGSGPTTVTGEAVDGDVTITVNSLEVTTEVAAVDNEMLMKTAAGEYVVVRLTMLNTGETPTTFLSDQQVLTAGGKTYTPDVEGTFYLGGISAVLVPGEPVELSIAFDVPAGSTPETLELHGDLASEGAVLALT
jgi:hypothetical protein